MRKSRFSEERIVAILKESEAGTPISRCGSVREVSVRSRHLESSGDLRETLGMNPG